MRLSGRGRQEWVEGGLAGISSGTLLDHCKEGGVGQVSHQLQPWTSSLLLSLSYTLSASFNHPPPASHPPLVPLLCSYKSISFPSLPPYLLLCSLPPVPLSLFFSISPPLHTLPVLYLLSLLGVRWELKGQRWAERRERERQRGNVKMREWEYLLKVVWGQIISLFLFFFFVFFITKQLPSVSVIVFYFGKVKGVFNLRWCPAFWLALLHCVRRWSNLHVRQMQVNLTQTSLLGDSQSWKFVDAAKTELEPCSLSVA